ncbi:peptidyl-tRNA hydrolase, partial [Streptomyces sp. SID7982]|nr:peptidyl-tRNA hydrolase [Streptomyces sp. SID7982]
MTSHDTPSPAPGSPFRSGPTDRDQAPQFVLPLVLHLEKTDP